MRASGVMSVTSSSDRGSVASAWAQNGVQPPRIPMNVSGIVENPATSAKLQSFINARGKGGASPADFIKNAGLGVQSMLKKRP